MERARFEAAEGRALEFIQLHCLYKPARTGAIIHQHDPADLSPYWHYNGLRGLDYMRATRYIADPRLQEALDLIEIRRRRHGRWPVEKRLLGVTFFD